jgi:hypothetical protein
MEELTFKIKNYLPINFNPYIRNYGLPEIDNEEICILQKEGKIEKMLKSNILKKKKEQENFIFPTNKNVTNFNIDGNNNANGANLRNFNNKNKFCQQDNNVNNNANSQGKINTNLEKDKYVTFHNTLLIASGNIISTKDLDSIKSVVGFNLHNGKNIGNLAESMKQVNLPKQHLLFDVNKRSKDGRNL